ncbi:hypothetical protein AB0M39_21865 [Streptomyces sp. NPDC051907]|uniref:hypothetical protein n=1 Tax=Streptomyces sp. NPDC051907 TaxID=3155284 RepID=UPI00343F2D4F
MDTKAVTRVYVVITALLSLAAAVVAACGGYVLGGTVAAVVSALVTGVAAWGGAVVIRRRVFADLRQAESDAAVHGYGEGLSQAVLLGIASYEAAAFPLTGPASVSAGERDARRTLAYRIAADEGLPHTVRTAAAAALEAIDDGRDRGRAQEAVQGLHLAVYELRRHP